MGFIFRVRLSSFFAGAAAASVAGFYFLYKDHVLTQQDISQRLFVNGFNKRIQDALHVFFNHVIDIRVDVKEGGVENVDEVLLVVGVIEVNFRIHASVLLDGDDDVLLAVLVFLLREERSLSSKSKWEEVAGQAEKVKVACESLDERIELLNQRITELEKLNSAESPKAVESID
ncbi:hypothetical protein IEQ34_014462 [Dendrobium chrysotoxum]|uniref:Uncharacterized protein n=1 Tax=Dendrobium chrysotoxum TaxID=161865 RepID=A0AAV7G3B0_DENCH|nr:hypothetical protein IEQ34_014462 [Dendrobium chrysotoxum]